MRLHRLACYLVLWILGTFSVSATAESLYLDIGNDIEVPIERYGDPDGIRLLWVPSEYGYETERYRALMEALSEVGFEVWQAYLHEAYFIPAGRKSLSEMPVEDIAELIELAIPDDGRKLFIASSGRGAALSFMALQHWLNREGSHDALGGLLLLHPNFMASTPEPGKVVDYLSIIHEVALPIYILQPTASGKRWYLTELVQQLVTAGNHVYTHALVGVRDGFQGHPEANEYERSYAVTQLPIIMKQAAQRLAGDEFLPFVVETDQPGKSVGWSISPLQDHLQDYPGQPLAPGLELETMVGSMLSLDDYRGRVVLINFWATWCPPCVEEIPSLGRLQQKFSKNELVVISVDVGETRDKVAAFLKQVPARYPVMLDPDGKTVRDWNLRAFPTTFVIDPQGRISLAYFGGLEWDAPEVVEQLRDMLDE
jgi:thiol-disulfide isomerase/thioredoxin